MKRILFLLMIITAIVSKIFAEVPELQKIFPTEWQYMNKYDGDRVPQIVEAVKMNRKIKWATGAGYDWDAMYVVTNRYGGTEGVFKYKEIFGEYPRIEIKEGLEIHPAFKNYQIYEEKLNNLTFYYYIEHESDEYPTNMFIMYLNNSELIVYKPAYKYTYSNGFEVHGTFLIPDKNGKIKAVCISENEVYKGKGTDCYIIYQTLGKDILGYDKCIPDYTYNYALLWTGSFLYDRNDPLKYALIKAFDGDLSTSYVEDSENDLLWIKLRGPEDNFFPNGFSGFKIVNGYAKDENWYLKNNRVKIVKTGARTLYDDSVELCRETGASYELSDSTLEWQECKFFIDQYFLVKDIYKGSRYNDTCIAELDFKYDGILPEDIPYNEKKFEITFKGWLFSSESDE